MVIIENEHFCIYEHNETELKGQTIKWKPDKERQFINYPHLLQNKMEANFLFDPTLTYFINRDDE